MADGHILVVEDDPAVCEGIAAALRLDGFQVSTASDGVEAIAAARELKPQLVLLDLILPRLSGIEVCKSIRRDSSVPIIMLTAKTEESDRIIGLEIGADDYITKPFSMRELIARIRAVLRRADRRAPEDAGIVQVGDVSLDYARRTAWVRNRQVDLTPKEFDLLRCLMSNANRAIDRRTLFEQVWGKVSMTTERSLDVHIRWLRQKIERDPSHPEFIVTLRGIGYRFTSG